MKRLTCGVMLLAILASASYAESESNSLRDMRKEIAYLESLLTSIGNELNQIQTYSEQLLMASEKRIKFLEAEYERLSEDKKKLERDYEVLSASEGTWTTLKANYEETENILEGQVRLWRIIAISEAVLVAGIVTYLIIKSATQN